MRARSTPDRTADTAFHSQQQPIVRAAWIVYAVEVDHTRADKSAQFQQMMPVAPIASEPRSVETQHGANLAGAKPGNQSVETRPRHCAARGASQVVVDDFDVAEAAAARFADQIILPPLTFKISLDLALGRLPDVDHGFPLQNRHGKELSACHRCSPRSRRLRLA